MADEKTNGDIHLRTQFQIDRIAFFSDAVIAISITLLVLEIKIPPIGKNITWAEITNLYGKNIFQHLIALYICFVTVGSLWVSHHGLFEFIRGYNKRLIKINLYFLFSVMLLPLSISFNLEENNPPALKMFILIFNVFLCYLFFYYMLFIIGHKKNCFHSFSSEAKIISLKRITMLTTITLLLVALVSLVALKWFYLPFSILIIDRIKTRYKEYRSKKKPKPHKKTGSQ
jgi:uncharacterized membrane protein